MDWNENLRLERKCEVELYLFKAETQNPDSTYVYIQFGRLVSGNPHSISVSITRQECAMCYEFVEYCGVGLVSNKWSFTILDVHIT